MKAKSILIAFIMLPVLATAAIGAVTDEEAKKLGTTLTAVGAEKAGNKDGSIPMYTGGLNKIPPGVQFTKGSTQRPDPFAEEKPLFSITQKNMNGYLDKLDEGQKTLLKKYPDYRLDVYKSHRTAAYPDFVTENTIKQAGQAKLANNGLTLVNAHAVFPFPIPQNGYEAIWNNQVRFVTEKSYKVNCEVYIVYSNGRKTLASNSLEDYQTLYWDKSKKNKTDDVTGYYRFRVLLPARNAGEAILVHVTKDYIKNPRIWQYLTGQRRTKLAPDIAFDTPNAQLNGLTTYDETFMFSGSPERFDMKLIGKKEMYVPYNCYKLAYHSTSDKLFQPKFINPDYVRWELHRVWVVQADLHPGKRHIFKKRIFYLDEDSWLILAAEEYDARGQLHRAGSMYPVQNYDYPAPWGYTYGFYDFNANAYAVDGYMGKSGILYIEKTPDASWSPEALAGMGIR